MSRLNSSLALAALALAFSAPAARAHEAGVWTGRYSDGSGSMTVVVKADGGGSFAILDSRGRYLRGASGYWTLQRTSAGGVLTMNYIHVFPAKVYFSLVVLGEGRVRLTDPVAGVSIVLTRQ